MNVLQISVEKDWTQTRGLHIILCDKDKVKTAVDSEPNVTHLYQFMLH